MYIQNHNIERNFMPIFLYYHSKIYRILEIVHGGKLLWIQNQIQFAAKNLQLTIRSSLMAPAQPNPKIYRRHQTIVKHTC